MRRAEITGEHHALSALPFPDLKFHLRRTKNVPGGLQAQLHRLRRVVNHAAPDSVVKCDDLFAHARERRIDDSRIAGEADLQRVLDHQR